MIKRGEKRSQITIFVIIAIVIVSAIAVAFFFGNRYFVIKSFAENPKDYVTNCVNVPVQEFVDELMEKGGISNPEVSIAFDNVDVAFLCYTLREETLCLNTHPLLKQEIEKEIDDFVLRRVESCFQNLENSLKTYNYKQTNLAVASEIQQEKIVIRINRTITLSIADEIRTFNNFDVVIRNNLYDYLRIVNEVINQEVDCDCPSKSCNADNVGLSMKNRQFEITKFLAGTGEEVYTIKDIENNKKFNFAIKNCVR